jgi:hypothetical protein
VGERIPQQLRQVPGTATITTEKGGGTHHDTSSTGIQVVYGLRCVAYQAEDIDGILLARNYERLMQDSTVSDYSSMADRLELHFITRGLNNKSTIFIQNSKGCSERG